LRCARVRGANLSLNNPIIWLNALVLILAIPIGLVIAWASRDELIQGRKWFRILIIFSIAGVLWFWLIGYKYASLSAAFILIVAIISLIKSKDPEWAKKRRI